MKLRDLSGKRFGKLTVIARVFVSGKTGTRYQCHCDCGSTSVTQAHHLLSGASTSCGCYRKELMSQTKATHRMSKTSEYKTWADIINRCNNPNDRGYCNYGGRGIVIDPQWRMSFESFFSDMGPRPSQKHYIDRRDNDGNYTPDNCFWVTRTANNRNKRNNVIVTLNGSTECLSAAFSRYGVVPSTYYRRIKKGCSVSQAMFGQSSQS